jgi:hypothetical protein
VPPEDSHPYPAARDRLDAWLRDRFAKMTPEQVREAKRNGAWLYSEKSESSEHIFPVYEWADLWSDHGRQDPSRQTDEAEPERTVTLTRAQLAALLQQALDMMAMHTSVEVQLHFDVTRTALNLPGALKQIQIAKKYGKTKDNICHMVRRKRAYTPVKRHLFDTP